MNNYSILEKNRQYILYKVWPILDTDISLLLSNSDKNRTINTGCLSNTTRSYLVTLTPPCQHADGGI